MTEPFLLYGSYGYTGSLIAEQAVSQGIRPILSGRDARRLHSQANQLGLECHPVDLDDARGLEVALKEVPLVLNCAGPFVHTFQPVVEACLRLRRHYLDITGEIGVLEALAALDDKARAAGVMLLPAVGFDVVPSDCLALYLKQHLPQATHLALATSWSAGGFSRGTALTGIEGLSAAGVVRKDGKLVPEPLLGKTRQVDFGRGAQTAMNIPMADTETAYYTTGIPNIDTYMVMPGYGLRMRSFMRPFIGMARFRLVHWALQQMVKLLPPGPTATARRQGRSRLWGEVRDDQAQLIAARMETPDGYELTSATALEAVRRVMAGEVRPGFQTPGRLFGADFILGFSGVQREDVSTG